jgi:trk system potassium uptake protein TrkA
LANSKHFVVIGLGSFGTALARKLSKNGCRVTGLDASKDRVEQMKDVLYEAVIGNATERETLQHLPLKEANAVFVSMGEDITQSLLATLHAKELGARRIVVKGVTPEHGKLLERLGVDRVVFPEAEIAAELADRMTWPNVIDFLPIDPEYSFMEVGVPDSYAGKTLMQIELRRRHSVWVVGVKDAMTGQLSMFPDGNFRLAADQVLLVVGRQGDLDSLREAS